MLFFAVDDIFDVPPSKCAGHWFVEVACRIDRAWIELESIFLEFNGFDGRPLVTPFIFSHLIIFKWQTFNCNYIPFQGEYHSVRFEKPTQWFGQISFSNRVSSGIDSDMICTFLSSMKLWTSRDDHTRSSFSIISRLLYLIRIPSRPYELDIRFALAQ